MFAEVIPYTRTIRGKEWFDYQIPDGMPVKRGDIVEVRFRSKRLIGLVWNIKSTSMAKGLLSIERVLPYSFWRDPFRCDFLYWFANYYMISLPTAFRTVQFPIVQRPKTMRVLSPVAARNAHRGGIQRFPDIHPQEMHVVRYQHRPDCVALYRSVIEHAHGHTLILVPEYVDIAPLRHALSVVRPVIALERDPSPSQWSAAVCALQEESSLVCIGTKRAVFLPWSLFENVIVDQEESRSHKQFDQNPRYHVRAIVEWMFRTLRDRAQQRPTVICASQAPTVDVYVHARENGYRWESLLRPWDRDHITVVDMEQERRGKNFSWFSDVLVESVRHSKKAFLFLNRTGVYGVALCADCSTLLSPEASTCSMCGGSQIRFLRKGTQKLEQELHLLFPQKRIVRIDRDQDSLEQGTSALQNAEIIVGTEKVLRVLPLSVFDLIGVLSVDHLLVYPHFRSHERVFQLLTTLCVLPVRVIIQTSSPHHPVIRLAVDNQYEKFVEEELRVRTALHFPPSAERFQLVNTRTRTVKDVTGSVRPEDLTNDIVVDRLSG